ncbi:hypothetical protein SAMD00024442_108_2 [Candidatus Symbiothrix dinenymphae]|nr:hypothetical protein SAMD00024442_108_2 [Candidatus Symbiothrix dinenymphae]
MKTRNLFVLVSVMSAALVACENEDEIPVAPPYIPGSQGVFILNEGSNGGNNASLTYHNLETGTTTADVFDGKLGDLAQDLMVYGSKLYITVSGSGCVKVLDVNSLDTLKTIDLSAPATSKPRYLAAYGGKVYATAYGETGVVVQIDTTSLSVTGTVPVGTYPEGIAAANDKLYVANSGYGTGTTVSVINAGTFTAENPITVPINPAIIKADKYGKLYLTSRGNFGEDKGGLHQIDPVTGNVTENIATANNNFTIVDDLLYFYAVFYDAEWNTTNVFGVYDVKTNTLTSDTIISDATVITDPYAIAVNPKTKDVYISDTNYTTNGNVSVFGTDGNKKKTIPVGINANAFVFN